MSLEILKENVNYEKEILREIFIFESKLEEARYKKDVNEVRLISRTINSLLNLIKIANDSVPKVLLGEKFEEKIEEKVPETKEEKKPEKKILRVKETGGLVRVSYNIPTGKKYVTIAEKDKEDFVRDLSLSLESIKKMRKKRRIEEEMGVRLFKKPNYYARISNKIFAKYSNLLMNKGYFKDLNLDMRKANIPYLLNTYISMAFMTALIGIDLGVIGFILSFFFVEFVQAFWYLFLIPGIPILVLVGFYFYPALEKGSVEKKINQELPFVAIHMSAIAGSGIEPSQIFKVIALGEEYPYTKQEFKKVINQVNVYGYDLVSSLKNAAHSSSSNKISELFNGFATTISSGGKLTEFLNKRAETLLFDYRLERERFTKTAETFMDIYISIVIAAPMIMMLMLVLMSVSNISIGIPMSILGFIIILIVAMINVIFLVVLHLKQPSY